MHYKHLILCALLALTPWMAGAQGNTVTENPEFGARFSVDLNKKIVKGLHVEAGGELRLSDNFSNLGRYQAQLGLTYKFNDYFKMGAGYMLIEKKNSENVWKPRHRFYLDGTLSLRAGHWRFALKERLQLTHRDVNNIYQNNPNLLALKSRLKVSYKGFSANLTPYTYVELRNVFNDPSLNATWSEANQSYTNYSFQGYHAAYVNRLRGALGLEWKLSKHHALDFFVMGDYFYDKVVDTNKEGTNLHGLWYEQGFLGHVGLGYQFSF